MKWIEVLEKWNFTSLKINLKFAEMQFTYTEYDEIAAWEMYVELITRVAVIELPEDIGNEKAALESIYSLFSSTRSLLKTYGRKGQSFSKFAVIILNQIIRPFTTKWHGVTIEGDNLTTQFRRDLSSLRIELLKFAKALAEMANVEDISSINVADAFE